MKIYGIMLMIITSTFSTNALSSDDESARIKELDDICLQVRTEKLKVVQEKKINTCINVDKKDEDYCRRYFKDYGWGSKTAAGTRNRRLFSQIPECIEAFDARKNRKR